MFAQELMKKIEDFSVRLNASNKFYIHAREGKVNAHQLAHYLANAAYLIRFTSIHLQQASDQAQKEHHLGLSRYFTAKIEEEKDHHLWAENDLAHIKNKNEMNPLNIKNSTKALVHYLNRLTATDAYAYLSYAFFAEYSVLMCAPSLVSNLQHKCHIDPNALSVLTNHIALDAAHVKEGSAEINHLVTEERQKESMRQSMDTSMQFVFNILNDVATCTYSA